LETIIKARSCQRNYNIIRSIQLPQHNFTVSLQEFYVNVTRKLSTPLPTETAEQIVAALSRWEVHAPTAEDVLGAIDLQRQEGLSFWDAMILTSAGKLGCRVIYSEDLNAGQVIAGVRVVNPFAESREP